MIKLIPKTTEEGKHRIVFSPRPGWTRKAKELEFELIYGHKCPSCNNVIQAFFRTPKPVNLWPYEETVILSQGEQNKGEILKVFPEDEKQKYPDSCYRSTFNEVDHGSQKIVLKNHILRHRALADRVGKANGEGTWEPGERPCFKTGIFSLREDLLIKDVMLFSGYSEYDLLNFNIPNLQSLIPPANYQTHSYDLLRLTPAIGQAMPVVLVEREKVIQGFRQELQTRILQFKKET